MQDEPNVIVCLACGADVDCGLRFTGSLRCADCREANAELDTAIVERWLHAGAPLVQPSEATDVMIA